MTRSDDAGGLPSAQPPAAAMARVLVDELVRCGVTEAVLSPGSRSAPLAFALAAADQAGRLRLHVRIDERSAGFLALGLAKASGRPVPVVTTSGTAAANLHPAVLEASESAVPLLVLTADRPPSLRGTGANQTVDQLKLYGAAVRLFHEVGLPTQATGATGAAEDNAYWRALAGQAIAAAKGSVSGRAGPVHLNFALREPLVPDPAGDSGAAEYDGRPDGQPWTLLPTREQQRPPADEWPARSLVIVGDADPGAGAAAVVLAEARGWPVVAEPSSGARTGPNSLRCGHLVLGVDSWLAGHLPERVLVVGRPTLHRQVTALLRSQAVRVEVVAGPSAGDAGWADAGRSAAAVLSGVPEQLAHHPERDATWLGDWQAADQRVSAAAASVLGLHEGLSPTGALVAAELHAALSPGSLLLAGSSLAIRDLAFAAPREGVTVLANRGAAGIDGTVSTAVGAALAWQAAGGGPAYALVGDLTFLHDSGGLVLGPDEPRPDLTIVVVNNDGGAIFALLEPGEPAHAQTYERVFGTPHGVDLAALCGATGTPHTRVSTVEELVAAATDPRGGLQVVEIRVPRSDDRARAAELAQRGRFSVLDQTNGAS
jgi:2-succinyl-5-enolpyruvyl-6-hydroxy-3-cyclohexene-1-carboxylate synthase